MPLAESLLEHPPARIPPPAPGENRLLSNVAWESYVALGAAVGDRPVRLTYDRGNLEIMSPSPEHERHKSLIDVLVLVLVEELDLPADNLGSTTFRRKDLERGFEPDECWYIASLDKVRGKKRLDLSRDPPPDLAIEVDVTHSSLDRVSIYEAIGVRELWRYNGRALTMYRLSAAGRYESVKRSPTFPQVSPAELAKFVRLGVKQDATAMVKAFRRRIKELLGRA
jgi:Uma2 family endonuclease